MTRVARASAGRPGVAWPLLVMMLGLGLLLLSCGDHHTSAPKITYPNRETPQGLLDYYAKSFEDKDWATCVSCFADSYGFYFDPRDWDNAGVTPDAPYWGKTEDSTSTRKMFADTLTRGIRFDLTNLTDFTGPDTLLIIICRPTIDVTLQGAGGEEPVTKQVRHSQLDFEIRPDPRNHHLWVISKIAEHVVMLGGRQATSTEADTFGNIKSMWR